MTTTRRNKRLVQPEALDRAEALRRRAARSQRDGELRKAVLSLQELAAITQSPTSFVALGAALSRWSRREEAVEAYRQALYLFRREGELLRARTVARLILALVPGDRQAARAA